MNDLVLRHVWGAGLSIFGLLFGCVALLAADHKLPFKDATSAELKQCPFGHKELKDVPVGYGMLVSSPETQRKIDNLEFWPGGCIGMPETNKVVCMRCRYAYTALFKYWEKHGSTPSDFLLPQAKFIAEWPFVGAEGAKGDILFIQDVKDGKVLSDEAHYWSSRPQDDIDKKVQRYLQQSGIPFKRTARPWEKRIYIYYKAMVDECFYSVELMHEADMKQTHVSAIRSSEKPYNYDAD